MLFEIFQVVCSIVAITVILFALIREWMSHGDD